MNRQRVGWKTAWLAGAAGAAVGSYAAYAALAWRRYGRVEFAPGQGADDLLDCFLPEGEVADFRSVAVNAPAETTFAAAKEMRLFQLPLVRAIVSARELLLGAEGDSHAFPGGLLADAHSLGWVTLAESPGREIVAGAVTRPWEANVVFRSVAAEDFEAFAEPDYVKIAWTLRAEPLGANQSLFSTETRAIATDAAARGKFRRYWALLSPGIIAIRWASLRALKADAEKRADGSARMRLAAAGSGIHGDGPAQ